jgi:hypothetical protein
MLTQKQKDTPYIGVFKLSTGEEVIASVVEETSAGYVIKNPLCMVPTQKGYQFAPLLMMADPSKPVTLNGSLVVATTQPVTELEGQYESLTTGIALPQKSSIIT